LYGPSVTATSASSELVTLARTTPSSSAAVSKVHAVYLLAARTGSEADHAITIMSVRTRSDID
jgi:hypothetical protein